mmetsp:Transcript_68695/g.201087  ORF Transcript_68695/g.201087 Transcript_68695/m.201087 type:complete len:254 (+) Transcript_68695:1542-2303(+)
MSKLEAKSSSCDSAASKVTSPPGASLVPRPDWVSRCRARGLAFGVQAQLTAGLSADMVPLSLDKECWSLRARSFAESLNSRCRDSHCRRSVSTCCCTSSARWPSLFKRSRSSCALSALASFARSEPMSASSSRRFRCSASSSSLRAASRGPSGPSAPVGAAPASSSAAVSSKSRTSLRATSSERSSRRRLPGAWLLRSCRRTVFAALESMRVWRAASWRSLLFSSMSLRFVSRMQQVRNSRVSRSTYRGGSYQ